MILTAFLKQQTHMYRRTIRSILLLTLILSSMWLFHVAFVKKSDVQKMVWFIEKSKKIATTKNHAIANQKRKGIRKDIWFTQEDGARLQYRIESQTSLLAWTFLGDSRQEKIEILEHLQGIQCWMQDRLYFSEGVPMQSLRFFEADEGSYQMSTQQFLANSVHLSLFRLNGHRFPEHLDPKKAFLTGLAREVSFGIAGENPHFQADNFKATLQSRWAYPQEEVIR